MAETLLQYRHPVKAPDGTQYEARACGGPMPGGGLWQGWIEFVPVAGGEPLRSPRETTQPNRVDTEYWATGLSAVYLEGALTRALAKPTKVVTLPTPPTLFSGPAPSARPPESVPPSVLNPFSIYDKGESLLRKQLGALSSWHLVNIVLAYQLSDQGVTVLNSLPARQLVEIIVSGVRKDRESAVRQL
jgi:hypothetical protein